MKKIILFLFVLAACSKEQPSQPSSQNPVVNQTNSVQCRFYGNSSQHTWNFDGCGVWSASENTVWGSSHSDARVISTYSCSKCDSILHTL